jgi:hypothetical protein
VNRLRFSILLAGVIAGLALLAVLGMASVGYGLLRRLANQDALARVTMASGEGATALDRLALDAARAAEQLAERRGLAASEPERAATAAEELDRFRAANGLTACALTIGGGRARLASGPAASPARFRRGSIGGPGADRGGARSAKARSAANPRRPRRGR